jgi:tRNA(Ile)-lysidine synthase
MKNIERLAFARFDEFMKVAFTKQLPCKILLALSGGPDSLALFYLFLAYVRRMKGLFSFAAAHVDHGWREESTEECLQLQKLAEGYQISFFSCRLDSAKTSDNKEAFCRMERLKFFKEIYGAEGFTALALGHHADDQAETVFKRLCEGSHLLDVKAMEEVSLLEGMTAWRPLLSFRKEEISAWLESKNIISFDDSTNYDQKFLRSRLRQTILPSLSQQFGKDICKPLCRIGKEASELSSFVELMLRPWLEKICSEPSKRQSYLDLRDEEIHPFLLRYLLRFFAKEQLSRDSLDKAVEAFQSSTVPAEFPLQGNPLAKLVIHKQQLFLY